MNHDTCKSQKKKKKKVGKKNLPEKYGDTIALAKRCCLFSENKKMELRMKMAMEVEKNLETTERGCWCISRESRRPLLSAVGQ